MRDRGSEDTETPISSLIDVVFLLIMFFVVTANLDAEAFDVQLELVKAKDMKPVTKLPKIRLTINIQWNGKEGSLYVMNQRMSSDDFDNPADDRQFLDQTKAMRGYFRNYKEQYGNEVTIIIRADKDCPYKYTAAVVEEVKASGLTNIKITAELGEKG